MEKDYVEISKLKSPVAFAKEKGVSRQRVYLLMQQGKLDSIDIDGTKFVVLTKKSVDYRK